MFLQLIRAVTICDSQIHKLGLLLPPLFEGWSALAQLDLADLSCHRADVRRLDGVGALFLPHQRMPQEYLSGGPHRRPRRELLACDRDLLERSISVLSARHACCLFWLGLGLEVA